MYLEATQFFPDWIREWHERNFMQSLPTGREFGE